MGARLCAATPAYQIESHPCIIQLARAVPGALTVGVTSQSLAPATVPATSAGRKSTKQKQKNNRLRAVFLFGKKMIYMADIKLVDEHGQRVF